MNGIEILSKEPICELTRQQTRMTCLLVLILMILYCVIVWKTRLEEHMGKCILLSMVACIIVFAFRYNFYRENRENPSRYTYKAIIHKDVNFNTVMEKYKVIGQEGKVWIIEDKE